MKLNILERIILLSILPKESNFITLKIIRELQSNIGFTENEIKEFELITLDNGHIKWNKEKEIVKDIAIGEKATDIIIDALKDLDKKKLLTNEHFSLFEKFVK